MSVTRYLAKLFFGNGTYDADAHSYVRASDYDALEAELALAKDALRIVQETSIEHAGKQNERIATLIAEVMHYTAGTQHPELALRQTAEGYAARNALRVIEVEAALREILDKGARVDGWTAQRSASMWAGEARALLAVAETNCDAAKDGT